MLLAFELFWSLWVSLDASKVFDRTHVRTAKQEAASINAVGSSESGSQRRCLMASNMNKRPKDAIRDIISLLQLERASETALISLA